MQKVILLYSYGFISFHILTRFSCHHFRMLTVQSNVVVMVRAELEGGRMFDGKHVNLIFKSEMQPDLNLISTSK